MKKFFVRLFIFLLVLYVAGFFLPGDWRVSRSQTIQADRILVHSYVSDLHTWPDWTAWSRERDPECKWTFEGPPMGKGASYSWDGPTLGAGRLEITESTLAEGITFDLYFEDATEPTRGAIEYEDSDEGLRVTWRFWGNETGSIGHWMALVIEYLAAPDFEKGLEGLKKVSERGVPARLEDGVRDVIQELGG